MTLPAYTWRKPLEWRTRLSDVRFHESYASFPVLESIHEQLTTVEAIVASAFENGNMLLLCGNGGAHQIVTTSSVSL